MSSLSTTLNNPYPSSGGYAITTTGSCHSAAFAKTMALLDISSLVSSEGTGSLSLVSVFVTRFDHLFELNNDSYYYLLFVRLINAHRVFVMNGDRSLFDSCYRLTFLIQKIESQTNNITLELPSQTLDIGNIFNDMKQLIGQSEAGSVCHSNKMLFVEADRLFLQMSNYISVSIHDLSLAL